MDKATVLNRVYASSLPARAKTVMFYLVNRSNKELTCFPAIPTMARETGLSERTVQRALKELCEEGYIVKSPRYRENGGQSSNLYELLVKGEKPDEVSGETGVSEKACRKRDKEDEGEFCQQKIEIMDFSFFIKVQPDKDCHRVSDTGVPP